MIDKEANMPKDLFDYPLKEIEGAFNTEMWKAKAGVRMKYKGDVKGFAKFEIRPMETIGIVISDFDITAEIEGRLKELFNNYGLYVDGWQYEDEYIEIFVKPK